VSFSVLFIGIYRYILQVNIYRIPLCNLLGLSAASGVRIEPTFRRPSLSSSSSSSSSEEEEEDYIKFSHRESSKTYIIQNTCCFIIIVVVVVFQGSGLLACSGFRVYFPETYECIWTVGRTPWTGDRPDSRPLPTHRKTKHRKTRTHIHSSSGIRTHNPSVRAAEDITSFRPLGHWDQPCFLYECETWCHALIEDQIL
jgi:hypothetical protein